MLFPNNLERQRLALLLLIHIHEAEKKKGFRAEEWLGFILEYLSNKELIGYYIILDTS